MIYVDVKGNLGNQLFEYACARKIQEETGQKICLNTYFLKKYKPEYRCSLADYILNSNVLFENNKPLPWFVNTYVGIVRLLKGCFPRFYFNIMKKFGIFVWMKNTYVDLPIKPYKKNYYLVGYWQSVKFFDSIDYEIKNEFKPKENIRRSNHEIYSKIINTESICVTIRRGDYVTNEVYKKEFFICDIDYFLEGIKKIRETIPHAVVFAFSDDIEWVRKNVPFTGETYYETGNDPVWEKLRLMVACKHFIISNSTFSWWAQHLAENPNKIVYAPSSWYPDRRKCDIYEEGWNYIEV